MHRLLLVIALIFAVLAAASALAYFGYTGTSEQTSRARELALMQDLAEEKVLNVESLITEADTKLLLAVNLDQMAELEQLPEKTGAAIVSVYVLDSQLKLVPNGVVSTRDPKDGQAIRDWFVARVVPMLALKQLKVGERNHVYLNLESADPNTKRRERKGVLFTFMKRVQHEETFYVVIEDDLVHLVFGVFPQFFAASSKRLYQVVDDQGQIRHGDPFSVAEQLVVQQRFTETVDGWTLRVAQRDLGDQDALDRKRIINSLMIGGAVVVILGGLAVLGFAIRRERKLNTLKSEFISNVSHELKTPLSIISMFGEMLANGRTKSSEQAHEYAEIIWRESVRLGRLIDNVLDFAKIERGMGVYEFSEDADIVDVVDRAIELSGRRVHAAEMTMDVDIEPDLPPVDLDANAYTLAVLNLVDNAIKYAADGKQIAVRLSREGNRVVLSVRDWGPGIDPDEHGRIFERFYRAKSIRLKPIRGSGIGLALVQHIARAHGGDVTVRSAPGQGSTFSIWIPINAKN